jgi:UDP-N-acetyl-2-amino-2-deoxyglucuronate dehydrogenase
LTIHVGILGGGNISDTHARAASEIEGVKVAAVAGPNPEKVGRLAERHGAAAYADDESFLRHRPMDVVLIGSPSGLHAAQGIAAARHGLHVLTEKPIDVTVARGEELVAECEKAGRKLGVFFQDRFTPDFVTLKRALDEGALGRPILASARVKWWRPAEYYGESRWRGTAALDGGGALINQGIHTVDLLLWLLGDVRRVWARSATALHAIQAEDTLVATLELASGALATYEATTAAYPGYPRRVEITGTEGTVVIEHDRLLGADLRTKHPELAGSEAGTTASASSPVVSDARGHKAALEDFLRAIRERGEPRCSGREGMRSLVVVEALYRSARTRQAVTLPS